MRRNRSRQSTTAFLILLSLLLVAGCKETPRNLPETDNYEEFVRGSATVMCSRMLHCYERLYRSLPPDGRRQVTQERCEQAVLENFEDKMSRHTESMRQLSRQCYAALLKKDCDEFAVTAVFNPYCVALRQQSEEAYRN